MGSKLRIALGATLVALGLGEGLARLLPLPHLALTNLVIDEDRRMLVPHPYLAYAPNASKRIVTRNGKQTFTHNALGFRGPEITRAKPEGVFRIVACGGSSTYGKGPSADEHTWPFLLEKALEAQFPGRNFEVVNAGTFGYSTFETLINLSLRIVSLDPDLVLIYHGINDVRLWTWKPGPVPDNTNWRAVYPTQLASRGIDRWLEKSRLYLVWRRYHTDYWPHSTQLATYVIRDFDTGSHMARRIPAEGPALFERNLRSIVGIARSHGIPVAFGTQAFHPDDYKRPSDREGQETTWRILKELGAELGVPVADLAAQMPIQRQLFTNEVHFSDDGTRVLAGLWKRFLVQSGLLDR